MESSSYFKSACTHCGGHIEAPAEGAGVWVRCPHCGEKTQLVAPPPKLDAPITSAATPAKETKKRKSLLIGFVCLVCGAMVFAGVAFYLHTTKNHRAMAIPQSVAHPTTKPKSVEPQAETQPDLWNGLKPSPITIEKPSKGRLMYAVGTIRNDTDKQRFGVKVALDILDANGENVGAASDYTQFIDAHKEWNYKALVTSSKATSAKVTAVTEN